MASFLGFSKKELFGVSMILMVIIGATYINLVAAERRARDNQRKNDIRSVSDALNKYGNDFAFFPASHNGNILACGEPAKINDDDFEFTACVWGTDAIRDLSDSSYGAYIERLPLDPSKHKGVDYYYLSDGRRYQLFAALESHQEAEYDPKIEARNLPCGSKICNFGLASSKTPLDRSLEEIEESQ